MGTPTLFCQTCLLPPCHARGGIINNLEKIGSDDKMMMMVMMVMMTLDHYTFVSRVGVVVVVVVGKLWYGDGRHINSILTKILCNE